MAFFARNWPRIQPAVHNYILSIIRSPHDVDDVLQEVAMTVCNDLHRYDRSREFLPWVLAIARFRSLDYLKKNRRDKLVLTTELMESLEVPIADVSLNDSDRREALARCLDRLQPRAANIIRLRYSLDLTVKDIAKRLGHTPNAISLLLSRSRAALFECIGFVLKEAD